MKLKRLLVDHLLQDFLGRLKVVPGPVERFFALRLSLFIVKSLEVRMFQALFDSVALLWVEDKHLS